MATKGVPYCWEISQPDGNDEGTAISRYSSLGAPDRQFGFMPKMELRFHIPVLW